MRGQQSTTSALRSVWKTVYMDKYTQFLMDDFNAGHISHTLS